MSRKSVLSRKFNSPPPPLDITHIDHHSESSSLDWGCENLVETLLATATTEAHRLGINYDDTSDVAITFVEKCLINKQLREANGGLLRVAARNHAYDFIRRKARICGCEVPWSCYEETVMVSTEMIKPDDALEMLFQNDCWNHLFDAVRGLETSPRNLFVAYYFLGLTVEHLARKTNKSPDAIRKSIKRACLRVRSLLKQQGCMPEEFCASFVSLRKKVL